MAKKLESKHPEWVLKHKQKGTEVRLLNGTYYLYRVTSKWMPEKKRSQKITGKLLGKITETGFIESEKYKLSKKIEQNIHGSYQIKEYGASFFINKQFGEYFEKLEKHFPDCWQEIISLALIRLIYQSPIKNCELYFETSYISELYPEVRLSDKQIGGLLRKLGTDRNRVVDFMKEFLKGNDYIIIDVTNIISHSQKITIAKVGYNSQMNFDPQLNLMMMFSANEQQPVFYRVLPGNIREISALSLTIEESQIKNVVMIGDKGFYSESNISDLDKINLKYIIPLRRNIEFIDYAPANKPLKKGYKGHFKYQERFIWYYSKQIDNKILYVFVDEMLKAKEEQDYLNRIEKFPDDYTIEDFKDKLPGFGSLSLFTKVDNKTAEEVYGLYKIRNNIETMFDTLKNTLDADRSFMQNEQAFEGWMFINYIALQWYYQISQLLRAKKMLTKCSPLDLLTHLSLIRAIKINNQWKPSEITKRSKTLLAKFGVPIT